MNYLEEVKKTFESHGGLVATACTLVLTCVMAYGGFQRNSGASDVKQEDLERRIVLLEQDRATRIELGALATNVNDFKNDTHSRLDRIETLLLKDLQYHRQDR